MVKWLLMSGPPIGPNGLQTHTHAQCCSYKLHGCPCGYNGDPVKECTCSSTMIARYQKRLSGPLLDRIDIHVEVPRVEYEKLSDKRQGEPSSAIRARVEAARKRQRERFKGVEGVSYNGEMRPAEIRDYCELDAAGHLPLRSMSRWLRLIQARPCDNCT